MDTIIQFIGQILAPLSFGLMFTSVVAGLFFGSTYNYMLNLDSDIIYHKVVTGWVFIFFIFLFRLITALTSEEPVPNPAGWIGIGILWGIFCGFILIGRALSNKIFGRKIQV